MDAATAAALAAINARFYEEQAEAWDRRRRHAWPGWEHCLPWLRPRAEARHRVLDVGCGNARFARFLSERILPERLVYRGIDGSRGLLALARAAMPAGLDARIWHRDLLDPAGDTLPEDEAFDAVVLFGVMHHVPGHAGRADLIERCSGWLRTDGTLIFTAWRLTDGRGPRPLAWSRAQQAGFDLDPARLEPGDCLLDWNDGAGLRYVHHADEAECLDWIETSGLGLVARFDADGPDGCSNRYFVASRSGPAVGAGASAGADGSPSTFRTSRS